MNKNSRNGIVFFGMIVVFLLFLTSCNLPTQEESGDGRFDPADLDGNEYNIKMAGYGDPNCETKFNPPDAEKESFEFVDYTLILTRDGVKSAFIQEEDSSREYCRIIAGKTRECIQFVSSKEYRHVVREPDPNEPGIDHYCYEANRTLSIVGGEHETATLDDCNGSKIVDIAVGSAETTKQGHCRYLISYTSRSASKDVSIFHFKTHTNASTGTDQEWYHETQLFAGNEYSEWQTIFASGETSTVDRVALVFTAGACSWVGADTDALDTIAQEVANLCD